MASSWFLCKPCRQAEFDPEQTVEVRPVEGPVEASLFGKENDQWSPVDRKLFESFDKENVQPPQSAKQNAEIIELKKLFDKENLQPLQSAKQNAEDPAARKREGAERVAAEKTRRKAEKAAQREAEEAAHKEALRLAADAKAREDEAARAAAAEAALAVQQEFTRRAEEKRAARKQVEPKVAAWCKTHGFEGVNNQKKTVRGNTKFPLHTAVKYSDQEIIRMMLLVGAQKDVKDSKGQTPFQLATQMNNNGSHDQIVAMLR